MNEEDEGYGGEVLIKTIATALDNIVVRTA